MPPKNDHDNDTGRAPHRPTMHDDVPIWADCCFCEAEPHWQAVADERERQEKRRRQEGEQEQASGEDPPRRTE